MTTCIRIIRSTISSTTMINGSILTTVPSSTVPCSIAWPSTGAPRCVRESSALAPSSSPPAGRARQTRPSVRPVNSGGEPEWDQRHDRDHAHHRVRSSNGRHAHRFRRLRRHGDRVHEGRPVDDRVQRHPDASDDGRHQQLAAASSGPPKLHRHQCLAVPNHAATRVRTRLGADRAVPRSDRVSQ